MRVVVDCNVLISAGLGSTACRKVIFSIADYHTFVLSTDILREYVEVSAREEFHKDQQNIRGLIWVISWNCIITELPFQQIHPSGQKRPDVSGCRCFLDGGRYRYRKHETLSGTGI
jgi:predicted nucleic acid-binding protein